MSDDWRDRAACKDLPTALFFPERDESVADALAVCKRCPVRAECLSFALTVSRDQAGVFGGKSGRARRKLRRTARATGWATCACGSEFPTQGLARTCDRCRENAANRRYRKKLAYYREGDKRAAV